MQIYKELLLQNFKVLKKEKIFSFPVILFIILTGINLLLLNLPLTNVLHYEFSAVNGILQSFLGGLLAIKLVKNNSENAEINYNIISSHYKLFLIFTFSQFLISFIYNALIQICPLSEGIWFYFILTIPSFFIGVVIGLFSFSLSEKFSYLIFTLLWLIILLAPLSELYLNPQIYFYNVIIGFFPGTIYDENITLTPNFILYRIINIFFFLLIYYSLISKKILTVKFILCYRFLLVVITALIFSLLKSNLSFATDFSIIISELKGKIETENFVIFFPDDLTKPRIENLILNHEYYYSELEKEINSKPDSRIVSFVFKDGAQKGRLFGAENADVAKPWLNQIYINYTGFEQTLHHELAHIFSAEFGKTPLKLADNFNPVLIEGFAAAFADNFDDNEIHFMAKLAFESEYKISFESLFTGLNFFGQTSSISYIYAGSFIKYLRDIYGVEKLKALYGDLNFYKIYKKDLSQLETEYFSFLKSLHFQINENTANLYFGRKTIFKRFCARYVAIKMKEASEFYQKNNYFEAEHIFSNIYDVSESYQSLLGKTNSLIELNKEKEALEFLKKEINKFDRTSYLFNLEFILGNLFIYNHEYDSADSVFTKLMEHSPTESYSNSVFLKKLLLNESDSLSLLYLESSIDEKLKIVKNLLGKYKNSELITLYLGLSENIDYKNRKKFLLNLPEQNFSANSLFEISKLAEKNNDYVFAKNCILKAISLELSNNKKIIYNDYLKKYDWLINNRNEVLAKVKLKDK